MFMPIRPDRSIANPEDGWEEDGRPLGIAFVRNVKQTEYTSTHLVKWGDLIQGHKIYPTKDAAPLWSPAILKADCIARKSESIEFLTAIVYDIDAKSLQLWNDVADRLYGLRYWMYSTWSHTKNEHAFRVVLPVDVAIPVASWGVVWRATAHWLGLRPDEACKDPARLYYLPSVPAGGEYANDWTPEGERVHELDWRAVLANYEIMHAKIHSAVKTAAVRNTPQRIDSPEEKRMIQERIILDGLEVVHPDSPMTVWLRAVFGAFDMLGEDAAPIVEAWSAQGTKYNPKEMMALIRRALANR